MVWNSLWPDGTKSVKQNTVPGQQNTTYTKTTLQNDHFWDFGAQEDGYHRKVSMENYADTTIGAPTDPTIPAGMDGVFYLKTVNARVAGFYRNNSGIYQAIPGFITGSFAITAAFQNVVSVPDDSYGEIYMWIADTSINAARGYYKAVGGVCQAFVEFQQRNDSGVASLPLLFGNGTNASGLNFRARSFVAAAGTYEYRITFWAT